MRALPPGGTDIAREKNWIVQCLFNLVTRRTIHLLYPLHGLTINSLPLAHPGDQNPAIKIGDKSDIYLSITPAGRSVFGWGIGRLEFSHTGRA